MRILVPSIVDPAAFQGGAGTVTRSLLRLLERLPGGAVIDCVPAATPRGAARWLRQAASLGGSALSPLPAKALYLKTRALQEAVKRRLRGTTVDLVLINGGDLLWLLDVIDPGIPVLLCAHNLEHALFRAQVDRLPRVARLALRRECEKLRRYEVDGMRRARHVLFLSEPEMRRCAGMVDGIRCLQVPPTFDAPVRARRRRAPAGPGIEVGFLANFTWWPNRAALTWLAASVLPSLPATVRVHLFGPGSAEAALVSPRFVSHGYVPDLDAVWDACDVMICPVACGAGVVVKLAEAVYHGMPVLTTSYAADSVGLVAQSGVAIRDGAAEWADFLGAGSAAALARERIDPRTSLRFASESHRHAVSAFVSEVLGRPLA